MGHELICSWLKIPATTWPPDHYTLLGLQRGETDAKRIERNVQVRMETVRCYQLTHPDLVTEAMNRLAQAFDCLRDAKLRQAYDTSLAKPATPGKKVTQTGPPGVPAAPAEKAAPAVFKMAEPVAVPKPTAKAVDDIVAASAKPPEVTATTAVGQSVSPPTPQTAQPAQSPVAGVPPPPAPSAGETKDPLAWLFGPWQQPNQESSAAQETIQTRADKTTIAPTNAAALTSPTPSAADAGTLAATTDEPLDPALEVARSGAARRGLGTKRALYQRISRTRQLLRAWVQAGKYLGDVRYRLTEKSPAIDLVRQLTIIRQQLHDFPPLLGQAGQPGYLVIALARQPEIVKTYTALSPSQRKSYVRDWQAGLTLLAAYRLFLREELWNLRRQTRFGRMLRAVSGVFTDFPLLWLLLLALAAANIAYASLRDFWYVQVVVAAALVLMLVVYQNFTRRRSLHRSRRRPPVPPSGSG
jgi:hypothetical protein